MNALQDQTSDIKAEAPQEKSSSSDCMVQWSAAEESWQDMLCRSAWEPFGQTSSSNMFFSMAPCLCGATLSSLESVLAPACTQSVPEPVMQAILDQGVCNHALDDVPAQDMLALEFEQDDGGVAVSEPASAANITSGKKPSEEVGNESVALSDAKDVFVFRLLASSLHRRKRARTDVAPSFESSQVIVQQRKSQEVLWDKKQVMVCLDAAASSTECNNLLSHPASLKSLIRWEMLETTQVLRQAWPSGRGR